MGLDFHSDQRFGTMFPQSCFVNEPINTAQIITIHSILLCGKGRQPCVFDNLFWK